MSIRRVAAVALVAPLAVLGLIGAAGTASADTATVPLTGEFLSSMTSAQTTGGTCNPDGSGSLTFSVSGLATGPYPGTFTETGSASWGPASYEIGTTGQYTSVLLTFSADFTITSPIGIVNGHKELNAPYVPPDAGNAGGCFDSGGVVAQVLSNQLTYTASTPTGEDSGTTAVDMNSYPNPVTNGSSNLFRESFYSSNPTLPAPATVTLNPPVATNPVGTNHTVTATVDNVVGGPVSGTAVLFSVSGSSSASGSCTTDASGQCSFTYAGPALPGADVITGCADANGNGVVDPGEPCGTATKAWVAPPGPATVTLTPPDAVNPVGTNHTVTATVDDVVGDPVSGTAVLFSVSGSSSASGSCSTDASGQCSFTYAGPVLPGADVITGCADANGNGVVDPGEPCGTATKAWVVPTTTTGQVTGGGQIWNVTHTDKIAFGFTAKSDSKGVKGECTVVDPSTSTQIKCLDVTTLVVSGNHATFFGNATVNGVATTYRIDVVDNGEPGRTDTFTIQTASGYTAGGVLASGNIQVH